ncbi:MAG TPA: SAM-dependent methyltransferase [Mycobacteriales bacterium]|nr:SAM-dependent methyltransferase [Mycobacteriales bacterium]
MTTRWRTWREAMTDALYGDRGFYTVTGVAARHFRTAAHTGSTWTDAIAELAGRVDDALGNPDDFTVVDVGAGAGEVLAGLAQVAPARWSLTGVDVADRPSELPTRVGWQRQFPNAVRGLVVALELLDVIPVDVVELGDDVPQIVEVDEDGTERLGAPACADDRDWLARWWPLRLRGDRAEIGAPRDRLWRELTDGLEAGLAAAVDYAANPQEHVAGTLSGYRNGRHRDPVPDGSMDLTAHVLFESMRRDGDLLLTQREALRRLGVDASPPEYDADPSHYLAELTRATEVAELLNPEGLGGFTWLLHPVGIAPLPLG